MNKYLIWTLALVVIITGGMMLGLRLVSVKTEPLAWSGAEMLSNPKEEYSAEKINASIPIMKRQLSTELARSRYYEALFKRDYSKAYAFLNPAIKKTLNEEQFTKWWNSRVYIKSTSGDIKITLGPIRSIRLLKQQIIADGASGSTLCLIGIDANSVINNAKTASQTVILLDIWTWDGSNAFVSPVDFMKLTAEVNDAKTEM